MREKTCVIDIDPLKNQNKSVYRVFKAESKNIYNDCLPICKKKVIYFKRSQKS